MAGSRSFSPFIITKAMTFSMLMEKSRIKNLMIGSYPIQRKEDF
jgi:hypothetical protein